jgi:putative ABC transport system permease protein
MRVGDEIEVTFDSSPQKLVVRGVLQNKGPARTLDGNFALMDIAAAQLAADRLGFLDYVDVRLPEGADSDEAISTLQNRLPQGLVVERADASFNRTDTMIAAFQFNLEALSMVALVVGLFLVYNTVAISVAARRDEIGILQAIGAGRATVLILFLGEAALLATAGVALGLPLGRALASYAVRGAAQTVETFYIAGVAEASVMQLRLGLIDVLLAVGLTLSLALFAACVPAWEAASVSPIQAVRGGATRGTPLGLKQAALGLVACLTLGWLLTLCGPIAGKPIAGFAAELLFMLAGACLTPLLLWAACKSVLETLKHLALPLRVELRLAASNLLSSLPRVSVSVAALAVSLSMMIAISIMVGSFRETVVYWLDSALSADLAVKPVMQSSAVSESRISSRAVDVIRSDPDVAETIWVTSKQIAAGDKSIRVAVTEIPKAMKRARTLFKQPPLAAGEGAPAYASDEVFVSESYSLLFNTERGGTIELPTTHGPERLRVAGVYFDYASNQGTVLMDVSTYRRLYADIDPNPMPQSLSVHLKPGADPLDVRRRIQGRLGDDEQLYCVTSQEIRREALKIFESTFTVTYALQIIAIIVAGVGVASTLITLIYERQRELGLLTLIGATVGQLKRMVLCEAVLLGAISQIVGIVVGMLLAYVLIYVINVQSFGWTIQFRLPWAFIAMVTLLVISSSALFGLYPAVRAATNDPLKTVREL